MYRHVPSVAQLHCARLIGQLVKDGGLVACSHPYNGIKCAGDGTTPNRDPALLISCLLSPLPFPAICESFFHMVELGCASCELTVSAWEMK